MNGFTALYLIACLDPTNHNACVSLPVVDSTEAQPDGSEMTMMGCMGAEGMNSAKKYWEEHQDIRTVYRFGGSAITDLGATRHCIDLDLAHDLGGRVT
jgi:hypothetical protein